MSSLFVVGHGLNVAGIFEDEALAKETAEDLPPIEINRTMVDASVMEVNADDYLVDREKEIVTRKKGGDTYFLNRTIEDEEDLRIAEESLKEPGHHSWDDVK